MIGGYAALERQVAQLARDFRVLRQGETATARQDRSPVDVAGALGIVLDDWQRGVLDSTDDTLLLVTRQGGKGMAASLLAVAGLLDEGSTTVIVSRADRQARRLLRRVKRLARSLPNLPPAVVDSAFAYELRSGSECLAVPGSEETVRGLEAVNLLIVDEAALVPDPLFDAVYPMLATTDGRCVAMTTARRKQGWFYEEWTNAPAAAWRRVKVTAEQVPHRISPEWLARARERLGQRASAMEFDCEFGDLAGAAFAFADVEAALAADVPPLFTGRIFA